MRILLTGAGGFIGSHLSDRLLADGHTVVGVDNFCTGRRANVAHLAAHPRFRLVTADASEPLDAAALGDGALDWVLHFASPASPPQYLARPLETMRVNVDGTRHLLALAQAHHARFLLASTSEVYGDPAVHPQPETYWGHVNPIGPRSVYDEAKRFAETLTVAWRRTFGLDARLIRIFNTYGPRMDPADGRVVTNFVMQALAGAPLTVYGDGTQTRSLQYVSDLVEGVVRVLAGSHAGPVNLGNPEEYTMAELAALVRELTGSTSVIAHRALPEDDPRQRRPDISLAARELGWRPLVPVREGLMRTIAALREEHLASMNSAK